MTKINEKILQSSAIPHKNGTSRWEFPDFYVNLRLSLTNKTDMAQQDDVFKKIVSHAKEYGFVFQSSEIYDGLSAV